MFLLWTPVYVDCVHSIGFWVIFLTDRLAPGLENNTDVFQLEKSKEFLTSKYLIFCWNNWLAIGVLVVG